MNGAGGQSLDLLSNKTNIAALHNHIDCKYVCKDNYSRCYYMSFTCTIMPLYMTFGLENYQILKYYFNILTRN